MLRDRSVAPSATFLGYIYATWLSRRSWVAGLRLNLLICLDIICEWSINNGPSAKFTHLSIHCNEGIAMVSLTTTKWVVKFDNAGLRLNLLNNGP